MIGGAHIDTDLHRRILLHELGTVKLADFGLSKSLKLHRADPAEDVSNKGVSNKGASQLTHEDSASKHTQPSASKHTQAKLAQSYKLTGETGSYR